MQTRNMWVSTGVALRLAQSLGLHRDGTVMKLPVLATEIRRRLWWQIRMLDLASAEDCGLLPTHVYGEDTRLPLNIDDDDLSFENMLVPPTERDGFTEMTPSLIRVNLPTPHSPGLISYSTTFAVMSIVFKSRTAKLRWEFSPATKNKLKRNPNPWKNAGSSLRLDIFGIAPHLSGYRR